MGGRNQATGQPWSSVDELVEAAKASGARGLADGAVHARRRPLDRVPGHEQRRHRRDPGRGRPPRPGRRVLDHRARAGELPPARRRRLRPADRRGDGDGAVGRLVAVHRAVGRGGAVGRAEGAVPRPCSPTPWSSTAWAPPRAAARRTQVTTAGGPASTGTFTPGVGSCVVAEDLSAVLEPGHEGVGWLAKRGDIPLGYLGDPDKTARTFPTIGGERFSVPGDRARHLADGSIELLGRDSVTVNSGRREDLRRGGRGGDRRPPRRVRRRRLRAAERAMGPGGRRHRAAARPASTATGPAEASFVEEAATPRRPLQAAEGVAVRRRGRALARRQGRLPLGPRSWPRPPRSEPRKIVGARARRGCSDASAPTTERGCAHGDLLEISRSLPPRAPLPAAAEASLPCPSDDSREGVISMAPFRPRATPSPRRGPLTRSTAAARPNASDTRTPTRPRRSGSASDDRPPTRTGAGRCRETAIDRPQFAVFRRGGCRWRLWWSRCPGTRRWCAGRCA